MQITSGDASTHLGRFTLARSARFPCNSPQARAQDLPLRESQLLGRESCAIPVVVTERSLSPATRITMPIVIRNRYIFGWDAIAFLVAPWLGYLIRFEGFGWSGADTAALLAFTAVSVPLKLGFLLRIGLYNRLWARTGAQDFLSILRAAVMSGIACLVIGGVLLPAFGLTPTRVPISVLILDAFITLAAISLPRTLSKLLGSRESSGPDRLTDRPTLIVGAGAAGDIIAREILSNPQLGRRLVGFADDDPLKRFRLLCGLPVLGSLADVPDIIASHRVREMIIAMPRARGAVVRDLVRMAQAAGVHTRTVPGSVRDPL